MKRICEWRRCGKVFQTGKPTQRFCCRSHKQEASKARRAAPRDPNRICGLCERPFIQERSGPRAVYCSPGCAWAGRKRKSALGKFPREPSLDLRCRLLTEHESVALSGTYRAALLGDPCAYCGAAAEHVDHIDPRITGGVDDCSNVTAACAECNGMKAGLPLLFALGALTVARELRPLADQLQRWRGGSGPRVNVRAGLARA